MKISFITDEFTQNLDEAITFALDNGLQGVELRSVDDRALQDFSLEEISGWKKKAGCGRTRGFESGQLVL